MNEDEQRVVELAAEIGPAEAYAQLTAENDALIRSSVLTNGREIAERRTAIYTALVRSWAERELREYGYGQTLRRGGAWGDGPAGDDAVFR